MALAAPVAAQQGHGKTKRDSTTGGTVTPFSCNPAIGCTAGNPPTVSFTRTIGGTIHSNAAVVDTARWCDDGGLNSGSASVTQNGTSLSKTYTSGARSGCWQYAYSTFTFTPVVGSNTIRASINDNFGQNGFAQFAFTYDSLLVAVIPDNAAHAKPTVSMVADTFTVQNFSSGSLNYSLNISCSHSTSLNCTGPSSVTVPGNGSSSVVVGYQTRGWNSLDTVTLRATSPDGHQSDAGSVIETASQNAMVASFASNNDDDQQMGLCASDCFSAMVARSTASYRSLGSDRSVTLVYQGDRSTVRQFVNAEFTLPSGTTPPTEVRLQAKVNDTTQTFVNGDTLLHFTTTGWQGGKSYRLSGQMDVSARATNMYRLQLTATAVYSDHSETFTSPSTLKLMVVNLNSTSGILPSKGWTVAGIQRLYAQPDGTILIVEGDGSGVYFSCTSYSSPCAGPTGDFSKLSNNGSGYTRAYPDSSKVVFNTAGQMTQAIDRWGNNSNITYDGSGRLSAISDPILISGFGFSYNTGYFTIGLPQPNGGSPSTARSTRVNLDGSSRIVSFVDADGDSTSFGYDGSGRLGSVRDRLGDTTKYNYDANSWKLTSIVLPKISIDTGTAAVAVDSTPVIQLRAWQSVGVPTSSTYSTFAAAPMVDTIRGRVIGAVRDTTAITVDRWGQPLSVVDPLGDATSIVRNGIFATSVTNPLGQTDAYEYTNGFLTKSTPYGQPATTIGYDAWGMPSSISGGNAPTVSRSYSASAHKITTTVAGSYVSTDSLDTRGRVLLSRDAAGHTTKYYYDGTFGNVDSTSAPAGQWNRVQIDGYGRDSAMTALGHPEVVRRIYDVLGRDSLAYDGVNSQPVKYSYNGLFLTTVRDPLGQVYRQSLNALGWATATYDPADTTSWARRDSVRYDAGGRVTRWQNRRGQWISQQWDKLGRMTSQRDTMGTADSLSYSANGRIVVASNGVSVDTLKVGDRGADTAVTHIAGQWFRRVQSATGGVTADTTFLTTSLGSGVLQNRIRFWSASRGVLDSLNVGFFNYRMGYNNELALDSLRYANATLYRIDTTTSTHQSYARHYTNSAVESAFARQYAYDSLGRITTESEPSPTAGSTILRNYAYTGTGALRRYEDDVISSAFSCSGGFGCGYTGGTVTNYFQRYGYGYDAANNLTSQVDSLNGNALTAGHFAAGNRDTLWGVYRYTYDVDGNRLTADSAGVNIASYTWSAIGRLLKVKRGTDSVEYAYNALGELVRRKTDGVVDRHFLWDNGQLLALLDGSGNRIAEYAYLPGGEPLSYTTSGGTDYYHVDLRGNVVGLSTGTAAVQQTNYAPWGAVENQTGWSFDSTRLGWKGNVWEGGKTNLYYVRNRWYDPMSRGFVSEDPIAIAGGLNTYSYAGNDPVNGWDRSGLKAGMPGSCEYEPGWPVTITGLGPGTAIFTSTGDFVDYATGSTYTYTPPGTWSCTDPTDPVDPPLPPLPGGGQRTHPIGGGSGPGSSTRPQPSQHGANYRASCSWDAVRSNALNGAIAGSVIGTLYGAAVGGVIGYAGGTVVGGIAGAAIGAPLGPGAIVTAATGGVAFGVVGAAAYGWLGAHVGLVSGGILGGVAGAVSTFALCAVNR